MNLETSIVIPFYDEEECVEAVISEMYSALQQADITFEVVAVQNGSQDRAGVLLEGLKGQYKELRVVEVPVNKGYGYGVLQGLSAAAGEILGYMPGDGQVAANTVLKLLEEMRRMGVEVGKTRRVRRQESSLRRLTKLPK